MSERNVEFCGAWLRKAGNDLITAQAILDLPEGPTDTSCFHCQQVVEKALKALLTFHGLAFTKTHDLMVLQEQALSFFPELVRFRTHFGILTACAVDVRYPGHDVEPDRAEVFAMLNVAEEILTMVTAHLAEFQGQ